MTTPIATRIDTREHLLDVGETLSLNLGFASMGLSKLLATAEVPKGSFYHYFRSKEAFGESLFQRYFDRYNHELQSLLHDAPGDQRQRLLRYYQLVINRCQEQHCYNICLAVKLSAEVSDLSEPLRQIFAQGTARTVQCLQQAIEQGIQEGSLQTTLSPVHLAETLYFIWLGAIVRAKVLHSLAPMHSALHAIEQLLSPP